MKRQSGFYWVKSSNIWAVAFYFEATNAWFLAGLESDCPDITFDEIDERKLVRPEPVSACIEENGVITDNGKLIHHNV